MEGPKSPLSPRSVSSSPGSVASSSQDDFSDDDKASNVELKFDTNQMPNDPGTCEAVNVMEDLKSSLSPRSVSSSLNSVASSSQDDFSDDDKASNAECEFNNPKETSDSHEIVGVLEDSKSPLSTRSVSSSFESVASSSQDDFSDEDKGNNTESRFNISNETGNRDICENSNLKEDSKLPSSPRDVSSPDSVTSSSQNENEFTDEEKTSNAECEFNITNETVDNHDICETGSVMEDTKSLSSPRSVSSSSDSSGSSSQGEYSDEEKDSNAEVEFDNLNEAANNHDKYEASLIEDSKSPLSPSGVSSSPDSVASSFADDLLEEDKTSNAEGEFDNLNETSNNREKYETQSVIEGSKSPSSMGASSTPDSVASSFQDDFLDDDKPNSGSEFNNSSQIGDNHDICDTIPEVKEIDDRNIQIENVTENVHDKDDNILSSLSDGKSDMDTDTSPDFVNQQLINEEKSSNNDESFKCAVSLDLSDIESSDDENTDEMKLKSVSKSEENLDEDTSTVTNSNVDNSVTTDNEKEEQLDFEAEEGECSTKILDQNVHVESTEDKTEKNDDISEKNSKIDKDLEEGELTDDDEPKTETSEPRQICRFYNRGNCTWGSDCRFVHIGVTDKGNYSMFESNRSLGLRQPPPPSVMYPMYQAPVPITERLGGVAPPAAMRKDEPTTESAWERGLRQAKEMIRKSTKRKETDIDFEDKKMNLTLGQEEIDKENDYYSRHSSPSRTPRSDNWKSDGDHKSHKPMDHFPGEYGPHADNPPMSYYPPVHHGIPRAEYWNPHRLGGLPYDDYSMRQVPYSGPDYYGGRRYVHPGAYYGRPGTIPPSGPMQHHDYYDRKQKLKPYSGSSAREVIVQKNDKVYNKDNSPIRYRGRRDGSSPIRNDRGVRGDEWADPWMRSKSPMASRARKNKKYSSKSSYSSSSGSSRSSSSYSSRSGSHSSQSRSNSSVRSATRSRKRPPIQFKLSPTSRAQLPQAKKAPKPTSPVLSMDKRVILEKQLPPMPQSPKVKQRPYSPPAQPVAGSELAPPLPPTNTVLQSKPSTPPLLTRPTRNITAKTGMIPKVTVSNPVRRSHSKSDSSSESDSDSSGSTESSSDDDDEDDDDDDDDDDDSSDSSDDSSTSKSSASSAHYSKRGHVEDSVRGQNLKGKSMDALKVSGQKQQIRLTLKTSTNGGVNQAGKGTSSLASSDPRKDRQQTLPRKRAASISSSDSDNSLHKGSKRSSTRREELLKQLRAVEDAIARKRSRMA